MSSYKLLQRLNFGTALERHHGRPIELCCIALPENASHNMFKKKKAHEFKGLNNL